MISLLSYLPQISYSPLFMFIDLNQELFSGQFTFGQLITALLIFMIAIILAIIVPRIISHYIVEYLLGIDKKTRPKKKGDKKNKEREKKHLIELERQIKFELVRPIENILRIIIFFVYGFIALFAVGFTFDKPFEIKDYLFTLWQFIVFTFIIILFVLFIRFALSPLIRISLHIFIGRKVKRTEINAIHKNLRSPFTYVFILLMILSAVYLSFPNPEQLPFYDPYQILMEFLAIIIGTYFISTLFLTIFHIKFTIPRKMDRHASVAFENLVRVVAFLIAIGLMLVTFGVDLAAVALVLTVIGFAIAFGMQNTIANVMSGFALAADKPFVIGDRIRIGAPGRETWGDVVDIGLNTTKIKTVEEETVVLPNNYIANNEIWNYTKGSPVIALTFDVGISYGSKWRLAKKIIIEESEKHPYVLRKPPPFVRIDAFADFSIKLIIWVWIRNALDKDQIRSDLLEAIKDRFDAEGVEIPFPYRTLVYKKDLEKEKDLPVGVKFDNVRRYPSKGWDYFEVGEGSLKGIPVSKVVHEEDVKILTPVSGIHNAKRLAEYSMSLAKKINGNVTAVYVMKVESKEKEIMGLKALNIFERYGTKYNINIATKMEHGDVVERILEIIEKDRINLVVIGGGRKAVFGKWGHSIANEIIERSTVPVVTMPYRLKWY